ncbi:hypothetical protein INR49_013430 [Caranx melampygus]|nr:hypothetical protein INR49_013430 [Caranx melampygus]
MSSAGSTYHNKRLASETDNTQRVLDNDSAQHLKMRDRQRFFEEVYQHDVDNYLPSAHLQIDCRKQCEDEEEDEEDEDAEVVYRERAPLKRQNEVCRGSKSRMSSTSSGSSDTSGAGADTPVIQSDDEEVHADTLLLTSVPQTRDEETEEEEEEERCLATKSS